MSTAMSAAGPTRRAVVHGVAWSVPVVAVAAAAPAFAASTDARLTSDAAPVKWNVGGEKIDGKAVAHVSWDLTLSNGSRPITKVDVTLRYIGNGGGPFKRYTIFGLPTTDTWTGVQNPPGGDTLLASHGAVAGLGKTRFHVDFIGEENGIGRATAQAYVTYQGSATPVQLPLVDIRWGQGDPHVH